MDYSPIIEKLPADLQPAMQELVQAMCQQWQSEALRRLTESIGRLTEAQLSTEQRLNQLAEAQARTEQRLHELAEAQARTEQRLHELAEAQARTE